MPPSLSISLELRPRLPAQLARERFKGAGAGCRVFDPPEVRLIQEDELRVAGDAAGEGIGQAERRRERQDRDRISPAEAGRESGRRRPQDVHPRIVPRRHAPGRLRVQPHRLRREAGDLLDARPETPQRAQLGDGEELVGIGDEQEGQRVARRLEGPAARFEQREDKRFRWRARRRAPALPSRPPHGPPACRPGAASARSRARRERSPCRRRARRGAATAGRRRPSVPCRRSGRGRNRCRASPAVHPRRSTSAVRRAAAMRPSRKAPSRRARRRGRA